MVRPSEIAVRYVTSGTFEHASKSLSSNSWWGVGVSYDSAQRLGVTGRVSPLGITMGLMSVENLKHPRLVPSGVLKTPHGTVKLPEPFARKRE